MSIDQKILEAAKGRQIVAVVVAVMYEGVECFSFVNGANRDMIYLVGQLDATVSAMAYGTVGPQVQKEMSQAKVRSDILSGLKKGIKRQ